MGLFLQKVQIPKRDTKGKRTGEFIDIEWAEYAFRAKMDPKTGYVVTMAVIVVPSESRMFWGASACSPEDYSGHEYRKASGKYIEGIKYNEGYYSLFNAQQGVERALGRARKLASRFLTSSDYGKSLTPSPVRLYDLVDSPERPPLAKQLCDIGRPIVPLVAKNAFLRAIDKEYQKLEKREKRGY